MIRSFSPALPASIAASAALLSVSLSLGSCSGAPARADATAPPPVVTVANPLVRDEPEWSEHSGRFVAMETVDVRPRISGYLQAVHFHDGELVKKGQLLFTIDPLPFRARTDKSDAELAQAQARLDRARSDLKRADVLRGADAISEEEYDTRKEALAQSVAAVQAAQASLRGDALDLGYTRILAPISGRISDRRVDPGNLVQSGQTVLTQIVAVDPIRFEFSAPEGLLGGEGGPSLANGGARDVLLQLDGETSFAHRGQLDFLDNRVDPATGTIRGRAVFANGPAGFTPGQFGRVRVMTATRKPLVLAPEAAIGADQSRRYVLVVDASNLVQYRQVELGPKIDGYRVIRSGVSGADRIVVNGLQRAMPGQKVKPVAAGVVEAALNPAADAKG